MASAKPRQIGPLGLGLIGFGFLVFIVMLFNQAREPPAIPVNMDDGKIHDLSPGDLELFKRFLPLKDPDSAKFGWGTQKKVRGVTAICGTVNAKNGFGGYTGDIGFILLGGAVEMSESTEAPRWNHDWRALCTDEPIPAVPSRHRHHHTDSR